MSVFIISFLGRIIAALGNIKKADPTPANGTEIVEFPRSKLSYLQMVVF